MALKLQGFDTILTFGGSHLWIKAYQAFDCLKLGLTPNLQGCHHQKCSQGHHCNDRIMTQMTSHSPLVASIAYQIDRQE